MAKLPDHSPTRDAIYASYEERNKPYYPNRLGMAQLGKPCAREIWYQFRWVAQASFEGRMYRLFETGQREEERMLKNLEDIGVEVHAFDQDGKQFTVVSCDGHSKGKLDGALLGVLEAPKTWHVFEGKTHSLKSFEYLKQHGVQKAKPEHYGQCQLYMGHTGMTRALYFAVCKNTDEIYIERIEYDELAFIVLENKAQEIVFGPAAPERAGRSPEDSVCRFCNFKGLCHGTALQQQSTPRVNCRTCMFLEACPQGEWFCKRHKKTIDYDTQCSGCDKHLFHPDLLEPFAYASYEDGIAFYRSVTDETLENHEGGRLEVIPF